MISSYPLKAGSDGWTRRVKQCWDEGKLGWRKRVNQLQMEMDKLIGWSGQAAWSGKCFIVMREQSEPSEVKFKK